MYPDRHFTNKLYQAVQNCKNALPVKIIMSPYNCFAYIIMSGVDYIQQLATID